MKTGIVVLLQKLLPLMALATAGSAGVSHAQAAAFGPSGGYLLRKAEVLRAAGQYTDAAAAYSKAAAAYRLVADAGGEQRASTELASLADRLSEAAPAAAPGAAEPAQPVAGAVNGGHPVGLFFMTKYWMATHSLEKATYYFAPGGQLYVNPAGFSASELAALPASARGRYTVAGRTLSVRWANGQTDTSPIEPQANTFAWNTGLFLAGRPFARTSQLLGSFEGGNSISTGSGSAAAVSSLTFRPDGTYSGGNAASFGGKNEAGAKTYSTGSASSNTGRWALNGWLLTLTDAQGHTTRGVAYPVETDDKTGRVMRFYFNSVAYKRL